MNVFGIDDLMGHDVFEFGYACRYPNHWNEDSLFVEYDEYITIYSYLEQVIPNYKYFAPQQVSKEEWKKIRSLLVDKEEYAPFCKAVDVWLQNDPSTNDHFWIYGV